MKSFKPFGPSLGKGKLSKDIVKVINNEIDKTIINKKNDYSAKLVSQIKLRKPLPPTIIAKLLKFQTKSGFYIRPMCEQIMQMS